MSKYGGMTKEQVLEEKARRMRERRNARLRSSDKYLVADFPITEERLAEVRAYRAALRALPEQEGFPDMELPAKPEFME